MTRKTPASFLHRGRLGERYLRHVGACWCFTSNYYDTTVSAIVVHRKGRNRTLEYRCIVNNVFWMFLRVVAVNCRKILFTPNPAGSLQFWVPNTWPNRKSRNELSHQCTGYWVPDDQWAPIAILLSPILYRRHRLAVNKSGCAGQVHHHCAPVFWVNQSSWYQYGPKW